MVKHTVVAAHVALILVIATERRSPCVDVTHVALIIIIPTEGRDPCVDFKNIVLSTPLFS